MRDKRTATTQMYTVARCQINVHLHSGIVFYMKMLCVCALCNIVFCRWMEDLEFRHTS